MTRAQRRVRIATQLATLLLAASAGRLGAEEAALPAASVLYPIEVRNPPSLGKVDTGLRSAAGEPVGVACAICHDPLHPDALARKGEVPADFHGGIRLAHGTLRCESCHVPEDRTRLRLADGQTLPIREVLQLCGQCHGPKLRDFRMGSHGGGRGYWDRSRGPWVRNNCVSCHNAHAPAYPIVMPAPPPNDRFLSSTAVREEDAPDE